jgi:1-phosphofructokinase
MRNGGKIVTVGLCPAWDMLCRVEGVDWGEHKTISEQISQPAGKALNISRALAWMGVKSTTAGLWGRDDYGQMLKALKPLRGFVKVKMTTVSGATRWNITIIDTVKNREMHLRSISELASKSGLRKLKTGLQTIVNRNSVCVFAGAMPSEELLVDVVRIVNFCHRRGAKIALDSSGRALRDIVETNAVWMIKPNVEELRELLSEQIKDEQADLLRAAHKLLGKVDIVLISRGKKGAIAVTKESAWEGRSAAAESRVLSTVGCGDYLLAGFLKGLEEKSGVGFALETAIKVAAAKAWGWVGSEDWPQVAREVEVKVRKM